MLNFWVIALLAVVLLHDSVRDSFGGGDDAAPWWVAPACLAPLIVLAGLVQLVAMSAAKAIDRSDAAADKMVRTAERVASISRLGAVLIHAGNVFVLGWLGAVRGVTGDLVLVDELVAITPPMLVIVAGWWSMYPVDSRLREATVMREVDAGAAVYAMPTRWQYVLGNIRHQIMLTLLPIALIAGWGEGVERVLAWAGGAWLADAGRRSIVQQGLQLVGVAGVFCIAPALLRAVWDTVPLPTGRLRERLVALNKVHNVRIRDILIWRTHGSMINGAVMGLIGRLRYVLLTDALLDHLPERHVEAVMAHEVAHVRCGHMHWLAIALLTAVGAAMVGVSIVVWVLRVALEVWMVGATGAGGGGAQLADSQQAMVMGVWAGFEVFASVSALVIGILCFGAVSRRFEWQADAFAVKHLSRVARRDWACANPEPVCVLPAQDPPLPGEALRAGAVESTVYSAKSSISAPISLETGLPLGVDQSEVVAPGVTGEQAAGQPSSVVTEEAVEAMVGALDAVAKLNAIPRSKRSWRHGSIGYRQARLRALVGAPLNSLPIDRASRRIKWVAGIGFGVLVVLAVMGV